MGVSIPQVVTGDRASGAQIIDGSLKFDSAGTARYLKRTLGSGNRRTWTMSYWFKYDSSTTSARYISTGYNANSNTYGFYIGENSSLITFNDTGTNAAPFDVRPSAKIRDNGWYHLVFNCDTTQSDDVNKIRIYINGVKQTTFTNNTRPSLNAQGNMNLSGLVLSIGTWNLGGTYQDGLEGQIAQFYHIDGQQLDASNFGFTDPLTNTWRPKKYTGTFAGTNTFYLPFDGNSPIGEDQSGNDNDFELVGFGGSVALDNPIMSGPRPILNTTQGGTQATPGVFGSNENRFYKTTSATNSGGKYVFENEGTQPTFSFIRGATYTFDYSASTGHPLRFATAADAAGSTEYTDGTSVSGNVIKFTVPHNAPNTLYYYCTNHGGMGNSISVTTDETKADKYASSVVLACPYVNSKEDFSGEINCTVSNKGSDNYGSSQSHITGSFYNGSRSFDGSNDNINYSSSSTLGFDGAFTIEMYASPCPNNSGPICSKGYYSANTGNWYFRFGTNSGGMMNFYSYQQTSSGQNNEFTNLGCTDTNKMYHIVAQRNSSNLMTFLVDGVIVGQASNVTRNLSDGASNGLSVGRIASSNSSNSAHSWYNGQISDLRIYKGIDKYDVSGKSVGDQIFVPASTNPDILPDSPSGVATKSKLTKITDGAVAFDGSGDYLVAGTSSDLAVGNGDFTLECFVYRDESVSAFTNFIATRGSSGSANGYTFGAQASSNGYDVEFYTNSLSGINGGNQLITPNQWHHVVLTRSGSTLRSFVNGILNTTASNSQDFSNTTMTIGMTNDGSQGPMNGFISNVRVIKGSIPTEYQTSSTTVDTAIFTPPSRELTNVTNTKLLCCQSTVEPGGAAVAPNVTGINNGTQWSNYLTGAGGFQSSYPATNAFNGTVSASETSRSTNTGETQTFAPPGGIPYSSKVEVWTYYTGNVSLNGGSNVAVSDDQDWRTIATGSGTLNTLDFICNSGNSMYLAGIRIDNTTILVDPVVPKADATASNFNPFNTDISTIRGQVSDYATLNPLNVHNSNNSLSDGNLKFTSSGNDATLTESTIAMSSGKFYFEVVYSGGQGVGQLAGVRKPGAKNYVDSYIYTGEGKKYTNGGSAANYGAGLVNGDVIGTAYDADNGTLEFFKNGVSQGVAFTGITGPRAFLVGSFTSTPIGVANFGQKPFKFPPPDGFQPLTRSTARPDTIVSRPEQYFSTKLYTGNGATTPGGSGSTQTIDVGFEPDMIWIKDLTQGHNHNILDTLRGPNSILLPDDTVAEVTNSSDAVTAFTSNGFTLGDNGEGTQSLELNKGNNNYVVWSWKAGGTPTADNNNTSGAMDANSVSLDGVLQSAYTPSGSPSTYPKRMSIGTKQGFSIVQFVGTGNAATIPHGLSETPTFIIHKFADASSNWSIWTPHLSSNTRLTFTSDGEGSSTSFQNTNSSTFNVASGHNDNNVEMITYCWHDLPGMFRTGTYVNNASADGPYIELGFKPALFMLKCTGSGTNWRLADNTRDPYNNGSATKWLKPSTSDTEANERAVDFISTGVKIRSTSGGDINQNSNAGNITYIYAAWAEQPAFNLYGAQSNAR